MSYLRCRLLDDADNASDDSLIPTASLVADPERLVELGRPRIEVSLRISGFFRDAFPNLVHLVDDALDLAASLDEPDLRTRQRRRQPADLRPT